MIPMELCPYGFDQVLRGGNAGTRLCTNYAESGSAHFMQSQVRFMGGRLSRCLSLCGGAHTST